MAEVLEQNGLLLTGTFILEISDDVFGYYLISDIQYQYRVETALKTETFCFQTHNKIPNASIYQIVTIAPPTHTHFFFSIITLV